MNEFGEIPAPHGGHERTTPLLGATRVNANLSKRLADWGPALSVYTAIIGCALTGLVLLDFVVSPVIALEIRGLKIHVRHVGYMYEIDIPMFVLANMVVGFFGFVGFAFRPRGESPSKRTSPEAMAQRTRWLGVFGFGLPVINLVILAVIFVWALLG